MTRAVGASQVRMEVAAPAGVGSTGAVGAGMSAGASPAGAASAGMGSTGAVGAGMSAGASPIGLGDREVEAGTGTGAARAGGAPRVVVVASDWLRPVLHGPPLRGEVVGVGPRAAHVRIAAGGPGTAARMGGAWIVAVEAHDAIGLPCGVRVPATAGWRVRDLARGTPVALGGGHVDVGAVHLVPGRWMRAAPRLPVPGADDLARRLALLVDVPGALPWWPAALGGLPPVLRDGAADLAGLAGSAGRRPPAPADLVARLVGWGPGSTPSGDDLLAAFVATLAALRPDRRRPAGLAAAIVARAPGATTDLSATLLACALDGAVALPVAALLRAVAAPAGGAGTSGDRMRAALARLEAVGHRSGRDLALGACTALHVAAAQPADADAPAVDAPGRH